MPTQATPEHRARIAALTFAGVRPNFTRSSNGLRAAQRPILTGTSRTKARLKTFLARPRFIAKLYAQLKSRINRIYFGS